MTTKTTSSNENDMAEPKPKTLNPRWIGLIVAIGLGQFLFIIGQGSWTSYWLMTDAKQSMATVTNDTWSGHNSVDYRYEVDGTDYTGRSYRNWQDPRYSAVPVGGESPVYYSASHPWLSRLYKPGAVFDGLRVLIIVLAFEWWAIATVINPKGKWALNIGGER